MRSFNILAAVGAAMLMTGAAAVAKDKDKPEQPKEKKICRSEAKTTSRIAPPKVCHTQAEWDDMASNAQMDAARAVAASTGN
jgi:hypothetical protein